MLLPRFYGDHDESRWEKTPSGGSRFRKIRHLLDSETPIGIGTGSTANCFIDVLTESKIEILGAVASSKATEERLSHYGIELLDLNATGTLPVYVDGADEADSNLNLIKGGGAALTREKIIAEASVQFVCIADDSKRVDVLGKFPLPVEVIPMARSLVGRALVELGGDPEYRQSVLTDNGNLILDVHDMIHLELASTKSPIQNTLLLASDTDILAIKAQSPSITASTPPQNASSATRVMTIYPAKKLKAKLEGVHFLGIRSRTTDRRCGLLLHRYQSSRSHGCAKLKHALCR